MAARWLEDVAGVAHAPARRVRLRVPHAASRDDPRIHAVRGSQRPQRDAPAHDRHQSHRPRPREELCQVPPGPNKEAVRRHNDRARGAHHVHSGRPGDDPTAAVEGVLARVDLPDLPLLRRGAACCREPAFALHPEALGHSFATRAMACSPAAAVSARASAPAPARLRLPSGPLCRDQLLAYSISATRQPALRSAHRVPAHPQARRFGRAFTQLACQRRPKRAVTWQTAAPMFASSGPVISGTSQPAARRRYAATEMASSGCPGGPPRPPRTYSCTKLYSYD